MKTRFTIWSKVAVCAMLFFGLLGSRSAQATGQVVSNVATATLNYTVNESLTISVAPTTLSLTGTAQNIVPTITYNLANTRVNVGALAYFTTTTALTTGSLTIPTSNVLVAVVGPAGGAEAPCTSTPAGMFATLGAAGSSCPSFYVPLTTWIGSTSANTFTVRLGSTTGIAAGSYSGVINFVAVSQ